MTKGSPRPKKKNTQWSGSKIKVLLDVFFDWKGTVHHDFVPRSQMVNELSYQQVLARLRDAVRRKRPELWENQNSPRQCTGSSVAPHPQLPGKASDIRCTPSTLFSGLAPADFFLFPKLKTTLKGRRFQTIEEIQENAIRKLRAVTESALQEAFQKWKKLWERCYLLEGVCFERGSA